MEQQMDMFRDYRPIPNIHFQGETISIPFDIERLNRQMKRVHGVMQDGRWRTLREISDLAEAPEASVSARLRDYRSSEYLARFFRMESERVPGKEHQGIWRYRVLDR